MLVRVVVVVVVGVAVAVAVAVAVVVAVVVAMDILISPHNDDAALFAAFTCLKYRPLVLTVFDGHAQGRRGHAVTAKQRRLEDELAMEILGCEVRFLGLSDASYPPMSEINAALQPHLSTAERIWYPAYEEGGHPHHNQIACVIRAQVPGHATAYLTYTERGKSVNGEPVPIEQTCWTPRKLRALSCYESQMDPKLNCWQHFVRGIEEYYQK